MNIELTSQEIELISVALACHQGYVDAYGVDDKVREFKALRMKIDSALLKLSMEGEV